MENEKRLIDANALKTALRTNKGAAALGHSVYKLFAVDEIIDAQPAVDAVEVTCRCKDCKYWKHYDHIGCTDYAKVCILANYMIGANGYCLYGQRKGDGDVV